METSTPPPDGAPEISAAVPSKEERTMAMLCHLLSFSGFIVAVPGASIIAPLILWAIKKDSMPFVNDQGKEAINFNITVSIIALICVATFWLILPVFLLIGVGIAAIVLVIIAAIQSNEGKAYRYPFILRLVK